MAQGVSHSIVLSRSKEKKIWGHPVFWLSTNVVPAAAREGGSSENERCQVLCPEYHPVSLETSACCDETLVFKCRG